MANMCKAERCSTEEVYVVGFVPSHLLPKKRPNSLDPFLAPLVCEIENIFIDGNFYNLPIYMHNRSFLDKRTVCEIQCFIVRTHC